MKIRKVPKAVADSRKEFCRTFVKLNKLAEAANPGWEEIDRAMAKFLGLAETTVANIRRGWGGFGKKQIAKLKQALGPEQADLLKPEVLAQVSGRRRKPADATATEGEKAAPPAKKRRKRKKWARRAVGSSPKSLAEQHLERPTKRSSANGAVTELCQVVKVTIGGRSRSAVVLPDGAEVLGIRIKGASPQIDW